MGRLGSERRALAPGGGRGRAADSAGPGRWAWQVPDGPVTSGRQRKGSQEEVQGGGTGSWPLLALCRPLTA